VTVRRLIRSFARATMALALLALAKTPIDAEAAKEPGPDDPPFWRLVVEPLPFAPRIWHGVVVHDDKLWVLGGNAKDSWLNDVWSSPDGENWTEVTAAAPWSPRSQHQCVVHDGRIWVVGGYDGTLRNDVWSSRDGKQWELVTEAAPWSGRTDFRAEVFNGRIVPGNHQLSVQLVYRGHGFGLFSYLEGYRFKVQSSYTFNAEPGKALTIKVVGFEKGGLTAELKDRPAVRYDVDVQREEPTKGSEGARK